MFSVSSLTRVLNGSRSAGSPPPHFLTFRSSTLFIIITVALAVFTDIFLYSVVIPILPFALETRANVDPKDTQQWSSIFLSVYGGALGVGSLIFGVLADKTISRRMPLLLGLLALGGSTAMLCAGRGLSMLLAGRILQGLSAAVVWTVGLALLSDTAPKEDIGQAMGYVSTAYSVASVAGPLLGGVVYDHAGYYAVFAMGFAIIGLDIFLRFVMIEKRRALQWTNREEVGDDVEQHSLNDVPPNRDSIEQVQPASDSRQNGEEKRVAESPLTVHEDVNNGSSLTDRLPPIITLLQHPRLLAALFGCFVQATSLTAFESVLPLFVRETFNWSSTGAGLIFTCLVVPALFAPVVGHISDKYGSRTITTLGLVGGMPFWVLLRLVHYNSIRQKILLCALLTLIGTCLTLMSTPLMAEIDHTLTEQEKRKPGSLGKRGAAAQGFGLFTFAFACGSLVGPLWAGFVVEKAGWNTMSWTLGLLNGVAGIVTFTWTGGRIKLRNRRPNHDD